ncbi:SHOCT domain-containing protein [Deinococcus sp. YIM 134068]|uniref:SHOCT domain-containing protein n=1 Tax=Deinococcus lichenicola TaxID=3118910 RepID=UPI002F94FCE4
MFKKLKQSLNEAIERDRVKYEAAILNKQAILDKTKEELNSKYDLLVREGRAPSDLPDSLRQMILDNLEPSELIQEYLKHQYSDATIFLTSTRVIIYKSGWQAGGSIASPSSSTSSKIKSYPYSAINGVEIAISSMYGRIELSIPGVKDAPRGGSAGHAVRYENVTIFTPEQTDKARQIVAALNARTALLRSGNAYSNTASKSTLVDLLKELAELHATGTITDTEFAVAKARLLQE